VIARQAGCVLPPPQVPPAAQLLPGRASRSERLEQRLRPVSPWAAERAGHSEVKPRKVPVKDLGWPPRRSALRVEASPNPDFDKIRYEGAVAELTRQRGRIAEIRTNAGVIVAGMALVGSFLGAKTIELNKGTTGLAIAALGLLSIGIFFTSRALWPLRDNPEKGRAEDVTKWLTKKLPTTASNWIVNKTGFNLVWRHGLPLKGNESGPSSYGELAHTLDGYVDKNQELLDRRANSLMVAILLLLAQAILWAIALGIAPHLK
jgi:hypothetical protein